MWSARAGQRTAKFGLFPARFLGQLGGRGSCSLYPTNLPQPDQSMYRAIKLGTYLQPTSSLKRWENSYTEYLIFFDFIRLFACSSHVKMKDGYTNQESLVFNNSYCGFYFCRVSEELNVDSLILINMAVYKETNFNRST